jgi:signal transduction histidine kinase
MLGVMLATLLGVSVFHAILSVRRERWRIEREVQGVVETLENSSFRLTDAVLHQMRGLSGAEYVLCEDPEAVSASTLGTVDAKMLQALDGVSGQPKGRSSGSVFINQRRYQHTRLPLRRAGSSHTAVLHVLYPEESYREAWWQAVLPPLVVGGCALLLVVVLSLAVTSRVTRPLQRLQEQTEEIARGSFEQVAVPSRDDEIADLSRSVNRMVEMLARYESEVRRNEQMRTLGQLGGGIGHQMRNAVTGCRMAIDLHARSCSLPADDECLAVATQQLELMERYLHRFLSLGQKTDSPHQPVDLIAVVDNVIPLVRPAAEHVSVDLSWLRPGRLPMIQASADALEQLLINLLLNAIEAAAQVAPDAKRLSVDSEAFDEEDPIRRVVVETRVVEDQVLLEVSDSGPGPAKDVRDHLFEPFVTEKRDGTGLGLWVAAEIVAAHHGQISWSRSDRMTRFQVRLPILAEGGSNG